MAEKPKRGRPKKPDKLSPAEYRREWRLRTGRTQQIGHRRGAAHPNARLVGKVRTRVLKLKNEGESNSFIARQVGVTEAAIRKFLKREGIN
jgi:DNA-binding NarL/FixJ family response regulator